MELIPLQIPKILSDYTNINEDFITLQSLFMNSRINHERDLFINENKQITSIIHKRINN